MNTVYTPFKLSLLVLFLLFLQTHADEVTIQGDILALTDIESTYYVSLDRHYPSIFFFGYEFDFKLSPHPVNVEVFGTTLAKLTYTFSKVPPGSYDMTVQVYIYFLQQKAWKVGEKTISITITDTLEDFFKLDGKQDGLPRYSPSFVYMPNKQVLFTAYLESKNSILASNFTKLAYAWSLNSPNSSVINDDNSTFVHNFTTSTDYTLNLEITANITKDLQPVIKKGKIIQTINIKSVISNVSVMGNNFVKNGSLLDMNITCNGSSKFEICYFFTDSISNKSCLDSAIVVTDCFLHVSHYFPENGTQYLNYGVRNDVSDESHYTKIIIYKIGPKPSLIFVILPLASSFLVIIIILIGIAHHIKQRRRLNATIEVATMENFGLYGQSNSLTEKSFFERIHDSLKSLFRCN